MKLKNPNKHNRWIFDFLTRKLNSYYVKGMTEQNALTSALFTKELLYVIAKNIESPVSGGQSPEDACKDFCNNTSSGKMNQIMEKVTQKVNEQAEQFQNLQDEVGGDEEEDKDPKKDGGNPAGS